VRNIPLNETAQQAIKRLCDQHPDSPYIVCAQNGDVLPPQQYQRSFYRILKNCGLPKYGVHSLRHTFATHLINSGVDPKTVSTLLGHASVRITLDTYVHATYETKKEAVDALDNIF
jgi:integrase